MDYIPEPGPSVRTIRLFKPQCDCRTRPFLRKPSLSVCTISHKWSINNMATEGISLRKTDCRSLVMDFRDTGYMILIKIVLHRQSSSICTAEASQWVQQH